jgi:hypothetical protein
MALPTTTEELKGRAPQPPADPDINLPRGVREQSKRAEEIQRAITGAAEPSVLPPSEGQTPQPPALPEQVEGQPPAPPPEDQNVSPAEWEQRYKAMKGRAEQMRDQMGQMVHAVQQLQAENATLRNSQPPPPQVTEPVNLLTEQEVQDYGEDFVDVVRRVSVGVAAPLQAEIQHLRAQLGTVQQETGNSFLTRMNATISGLIPNWQEINRHPRFMHWVQLPDVFSGAIRQQLMQAAWDNGDAMRVAAFFQAFLAEEAAVDPARSMTPGMSVQPTPLQNGASVPLGTRLSLDNLAAPGRAHSGAQMPTEKRVYSAQDISRFYTEVAAGKWRARDAERAAIDADIIAAQHEGRIIPDQRTITPMGFTGGR